MNNIDKAYTDLLQDILDNNCPKTDRTGTGTISVFGRQIRHKMSEGFPLLTTKKMAWKTMVTELLWFLRGDTNIKYLVDNGCHIWDGDAYKNYVSKIEEYTSTLNVPNDISEFQEIMDSVGNQIKNSVLSKEEFIHKIKTDDEFAKEWGELGPIYGKQWREWKRVTYNDENRGGFYNPIDQIANLISELKTNPDSRRLMVNAWNCSDLDSMVLPPCHYGFQVYTRELSEDERYDLCAAQKSKMTAISEEDYIKYNIPTRAISLMWNQRSCDFPLGIPMNISSYSLLLMMIAKQVNMVPDEVIGNLGDCHIYLNQIDGVKEQLTREPYELPTVKISDRVVNDISEYTLDDIILENYQSHPAIKMPLSN